MCVMCINHSVICGNFVSGDRLWFREAGEGPHVDIVRDPGVSGPRDHPQQGEPRCPSFPEETETCLQSMQQTTALTL